MLNNLMLYAVNQDGIRTEIDTMVTELDMNTELDKPYTTLTFTIPYGIYSKSIPSIFLDTGTRIEMYEFNSGKLRFVGTVDETVIDGDKEEQKVTCHDYIYNLVKSKVFYNFKNMSAFDCIKQIFDDLQIPYSVNNKNNIEGILGGADSDDGRIMIKHIVKNKTAYDAIMCVATECYTMLGHYYYVYMDVAGNVNVTQCDRYWAEQVIKSGKDGNILGCSYKKDSSEIITRVICYSSTGEEESLEMGEGEE